MAAVIDPLVEKLVEAQSAHVFQRLLQVIGGHDAIPMAVEVCFHAFSKEVGTELAAQHVQDPSPFGIRAVVELLHGIGVVAPDHRFGIRSGSEHGAGFIP